MHQQSRIDKHALPLAFPKGDEHYVSTAEQAYHFTYLGAILIPPSILFNYLSVDLAALKEIAQELANLF